MKKFSYPMFQPTLTHTILTTLPCQHIILETAQKCNMFVDILYDFSLALGTIYRFILVRRLQTNFGFINADLLWMLFHPSDCTQ